ncbi:MAG: hypothetical protein J6M41_08470 [Prevotella sp.]|nr:hypothetical protein [Prevotella sp.]
MPNCKEFFLDDVMAVTAIPVTDFDPGFSDWQLQPVIAVGTFSPTITRAITIGQQPATTGGTLIPIMRLTGKAKDDESDQTAGRLHKVTVSCQIDDRDLSRDQKGLTVLDHLLTLERTPNHLLLTFRDLSRAFVQANKDTYLCTVDRDGAKTSVQFRIECLMGIQMIV